MILTNITFCDIIEYESRKYTVERGEEDMKARYEPPKIMWMELEKEDVIRTSTKNELEPDWNDWYE